MAILIQFRLDTAANWTAANPILAQGEPAIEIDTRKEKIGNGVTAWNDLAYKSLADVDSMYLGFYATEAALTAAYPTAFEGNYAVVGATDTVWIWDTDTTDWVDSGNELGSVPINSVGVVELKNEVKDNILWKDNTTPFTPDADYEPATKKYVDENSGLGGIQSVVAGTNVTVDATDPLNPVVNSTGGGDESEKYTSVLHLGNSITKHPINSWWWGEWGMAATIRENDYVHKFWDLLKEKNPNVTSNAEFIADWETDYTTFDKTILNTAILASDLVVLRIGENVTYYADYQNQYKLLVQHIQTVNPNAQIILGGLFWTNEPIETAMRNVADELQLPYVVLNHLDTPTYKESLGNFVYGDDGELHEITNAGVAEHPSDLGMNEIAKSLFSALDFEDEIDKTFPQKDIYTNITLNNSHNGCILKVKANISITVPSDLKPFFKVIVHSQPTFTTTFIADSNSIITTTDLVLTPNKLVTLYKDGSAPIYNITTNTNNSRCVWTQNIIVSDSVTGTTNETYVRTIELPKDYLSGNGSVEIEIRGAKSAEAVFAQMFLYINSSDVDTNKTLLAKADSSSSATTGRNLSIRRNLIFSSTQIQTGLQSVSASDDVTGASGNFTNRLIDLSLQDKNFLRIYLKCFNTTVTASIYGISIKIYN